MILRHEDAVEFQQAKHGKGLLAGPQDRHLAVVSPNGLEESDQRAHALAVDQAKAGQINLEVRGPLFGYPADRRSEITDRNDIELTSNAQDRCRRLCAEIVNHEFSLVVRGLKDRKRSLRGLDAGAPAALRFLLP